HRRRLVSAAAIAAGQRHERTRLKGPRRPGNAVTNQTAWEGCPTGKAKSLHSTYQRASFTYDAQGIGNREPAEQLTPAAGCIPGRTQRPAPSSGTGARPGRSRGRGIFAVAVSGRRLDLGHADLEGAGRSRPVPHALVRSDRLGTG